MEADYLLIKRMKQGDEGAFDQFIHKYYQDILNYCSYHCGNNEDAEDLTQETFVNFFSRLSDYQFRGKSKNYLYTISGNLCKNFYKKKKDIPIESFQLENIESDKDENLKIDNKMFIEWALRELSEEYKEVIILYYFEELKLKDIAKILNIGLPLVKYRLRQAKMQLKELLEKEDRNENRRSN